MLSISSKSDPSVLGWIPTVSGHCVSIISQFNDLNMQLATVIHVLRCFEITGCETIYTCKRYLLFTVRYRAASHEIKPLHLSKSKNYFVYATYHTGRSVRYGSLESSHASSPFQHPDLTTGRKRYLCSIAKICHVGYTRALMKRRCLTMGRHQAQGRVQVGVILTKRHTLPGVTQLKSAELHSELCVPCSLGSYSV